MGLPLQFIPRSVWDKEANETFLDREIPESPVKNIFYSQTRMFKDRLRTHCLAYWNHGTTSNIEKMQIIYNSDRRNHEDVRFSFLIGSDAKVYEGQGWQPINSLPRKYRGFNQQSLLIGYMEPMPGNKPSPEMIAAKNTLLEYGVKNGLISAKCHEIYLDNYLFWKSFNKYISRP